MIVLFLDIDGVLNKHADYPEGGRWPNGFSRLQLENVQVLNTFLAMYPEVQLVLTSAWRYAIHRGDMTLAGMELLLKTHGLNCAGRLLDVTETDEDHAEARWNNTEADREAYWAWLKEHGTEIRVLQILKWIKGSQLAGSIRAWAVIDDLPLKIAHFIQTDPAVGLTWPLALRIESEFQAQGVEI